MSIRQKPTETTESAPPPVLAMSRLSMVLEAGAKNGHESAKTAGRPGLPDPKEKALESGVVKKSSKASKASKAPPKQTPEEQKGFVFALADRVLAETLFAYSGMAIGSNVSAWASALASEKMELYRARFMHGAVEARIRDKYFNKIYTQIIATLVVAIDEFKTTLVVMDLETQGKKITMASRLSAAIIMFNGDPVSSPSKKDQFGDDELLAERLEATKKFEQIFISAAP